MFVMTAAGAFDICCLESADEDQGWVDPSALALEVRGVASRAYALLRGSAGASGSDSGPEEDLVRLQEQVDRLRQQICRMGHRQRCPIEELASWADALWVQIHQRLSTHSR